MSIIAHSPLRRFAVCCSFFLTLLTATAFAQPTEEVPAEKPGETAEAPVAEAPPTDADVPPAGPATTAGNNRPTTEADEAQGKCLSPRQAWLQLLYWLQQDTRWEPNAAAACLGAGDDGPDLAVKLKKTLDARNVEVPVGELPREHDYTDETGKHQYTLAAGVLGDVIVEKKGDRWLFSAATLARVPALYREIGIVDRVVKWLPDWVEDHFLGVQIWQLFGVFVLLLLAFTVQKITIFLLSNYVRRLVSALHVQWVADTITRIDRPIGGLVMALLFRMAFPMLQFPIRVSRWAHAATSLLLAFSAVWLGGRLVEVLTNWLQSKAEKTESRLDDQLVPLLRKTLKIFVWVIGGIFVLQNMNVDVGSLLAGLGLGGLAFALAARDTIANFFGSVMIFIDKPFQIGDWILVGEVEGTVEEVGFRTTRVRTFYNSLVTVPNSMISTHTVDNMGERKYRRYSTTLGLTYDTPPEKIQAFLDGIRAIIVAMPGMRKDYYLIEFKEFGPSSLDLMVYTFMDVENWIEEMKTRTNFNMEIMRLAERLGVSFAFPTQTLHVESLVNAGTLPKAHKAPPKEELAKVVKSFGPGGEAGHPDGIKLTSGYYPGSQE